MTTFIFKCSLSLAAGLLLSQFAPSQFCSARNTFRIANSHSSVGSELNVDTGWVGTLPLFTPGSNNHPGPACSSQASCSVLTDFGSMRITGSGTGTNCILGGGPAGTVLRLDQSPQASFNESFTITSTTLPNGTPVQVRIDLSLDGYATIIDTNPIRDFNAVLSCNSSVLTIANGPGVQSASFTGSVGGSYMLSASLSVTLVCQGLTGGLLQTSSFATDLVANFAVECTTPGATINSCFGRTYQPLAARMTELNGGCGPGSPNWSGTLPVLGTTQTWTLQGAAPLQPAFLVASFAQPTPTNIGACIALVNLPTSFSALIGTTTNAGSANFSLAIPASSAFAGIRLTTQALVMQPGGPLLGIAQLSNAVLATFGT